MKKIVLISIIILAGILRLVSLSSFPAGLNADEAALGYNAYSLISTGKDEHGHPWPVNLESFGDYKPALYAYILIPFVKVLGLTELAVRLPSALFGVLAVIFIYLLARELFENSKIGKIAAFLLAISPWHVHFSRGGWEVNVATTLMIIGTWSFIRWTKTAKFLSFVICILSFVLSMYTYQSARVLSPLLGLGLAIFYVKALLSRPKQTLVAALLALVMLLPLGISLSSSKATSRLAGVGLLADEGPLNRIKELRGHYSQWNSLPARLLHNQPLAYTWQFIKNYSDHFDPNFLFISGDTVPRSKIPETGQLYLTDIIFLLLGVIFLLRRRFPHSKVIWLWLAIAPVASALTFQTPSALRSQNMVIPLTMLAACGIYYLFYFFAGHRRLLSLLTLVLITVYTWQVTRYLHQYYVHYPKTYPAAWEYGFKELVPYVESVKSKYDRVLVTDTYDQPYILFLFYSKLAPSEFQHNHVLTFRDKFNFSTVRAYDKYRFTSTSWETVRDIHPSLIVAAPDDIPPVGVNIVKTIFFPNGQPAFKIISN